MPHAVVEGEPMDGLVRISAAVAVTSMVAFTVAGCALLPPVERFSDEATVTDVIATVELDDPRGSVTVVGDDDATEVSISRTLRYRGERPEGETHEVDGDVLVLSGCGRRCTAEYRVEVPGSVDVTGSTTNGHIELTAVDDVEVQTTNGHIELDEIGGIVDVETSNGRIEGRELGGDSGIRAITSNGAIELEMENAQDVEATTSNGAITLTVPDAPFRVSAETVNGATHIDDVDQDSDAEHTLELRTVNGSITVNVD